MDSYTHHGESLAQHCSITLLGFGVNHGIKIKNTYIESEGILSLWLCISPVKFQIYIHIEHLVYRFIFPFKIMCPYTTELKVEKKKCSHNCQYGMIMFDYKCTSNQTDCRYFLNSGQRNSFNITIFKRSFSSFCPLQFLDWNNRHY